MSNITLYGISNCDTVRKARNWLKSHAINFKFIDVRKQPLAKTTIEAWFKYVDWESILNRRSTCWRQLEDHVRNNIQGNNVATLLLEYPTLMKRPVLATGQQLLVGFNEQDYQKLLG